MTILLGCVAAWHDVRHRVVPNWMPVSALCGGLLWHTARQGLHGAALSLGGTAAGFGVFLLFYLLGGMGGGDVKLMAGFGALLGPPGILTAALLASIAGGALALGMALWKRGERSIPYAPAIVLGTWLALLAER